MRTLMNFNESTST